jgi:hypothetical protein
VVREHLNKLEIRDLEDRDRLRLRFAAFQTQ